MAFVTTTPLATGKTAAPSLAKTGVTPVPTHPQSTSTAAAAKVRMGYGAYSYLTDKTKGHVNQYYVDKFRIAADFIKGAPGSEADAKLGRTAKGAVLVPKEGIPQMRDAALPAIDTTVEPDPRIKESEGAVYSWDLYYEDPKFAASTYANTEDEEVALDSFVKYRGSVNMERGASLTHMNFGAAARAQRVRAGMDEAYLLTLDGMLDARYALLQDIDDPATLSPTGTPQTEIPGTPYLSSVGALDFMKQSEESVSSLWKQ